MKALVTGAAGFLGSRLVRLLLARGHAVRALLRPGQALGPLAGLEVEEARGDVTEPHSLERAVEGCDWAFHLAGVRRAASRQLFLEVNAEGTRHLVEACLSAAPGLARLVLAGSLAAAGPSATGKREEDPLQPAEWYGESKAEAERIALSYAGRLPVTVARPPRIVGPGDRENLVFFKIVKAGFLLDLRGPPRPLSFVDVEDCARGFLLLAESPAAPGEAFFLASEERTDLVGLQRQVARALGVSPRALPVPAALLSALAWVADAATLASGVKLPLNRKLARQMLAPGWTCDPGKARRLLGFEARVSLAESVDRAARWYREQAWL
ncbi:MAG TPA: NAD-dependent epimerase/dehydratase family protein [Anaeromyxobacteraceae bacterium]|nr:NAD-dependent epimerase/dehydratase family protein [Anaeromyxobacteraceae bacterium]